jgi:thioredoxin reductase
VPYDVAVIGGGPAGLAAALWAARYRRRVILIDAGEQRNRWTEATHGYLANEGMAPTEVIAAARRDLAGYEEIDLIDGARVANAQVDSNGMFQLTLEGGHVAAHRLVVATGVRDVFPDVRNFAAHFGRSIFTCPSCDGYEAQDRAVAVVGDSPEMAEFAVGLFDWARSVTLVTERPRLGSSKAATDGFEITEVVGRVVSVSGDDGNLRSLELEGGRSVACDVAFWHMPIEQQSDVAVQLGCTLEDGYVVADEDGMTSVRHVYAAGDMTPGPQLLQIAAAEGARAGIAAAQSLRGHSGSPMSPRPAPDPDRWIADPAG